MLAAAYGFQQDTIYVDRGPVEAVGRLLVPNLEPGFVKYVLQDLDVFSLETATEIASGGRVGNASGVESVEKDFVIVAKFEILKTGAFTEGVVGQVEYMIGLMVEQVNLEQMELLVDGLGQLEPAYQFVKALMPPCAVPRSRSAIS